VFALEPAILERAGDSLGARLLAMLVADVVLLAAACGAVRRWANGGRPPVPRASTWATIRTGAFYAVTWELRASMAVGDLEVLRAACSAA
jgi:hypothetical protein